MSSTATTSTLLQSVDTEDPFFSEFRAKALAQVAKIRKRLDKELSPGAKQLAEKRSDELVELNKKYAEYTFELSFALGKPMVAATSDRVHSMATKDLPEDPVARIQFLRHAIKHMSTDTVEG